LTENKAYACTNFELLDIWLKKQKTRF